VQGFFHDDAEDRLFDAIAVDQGFERQAPLAIEFRLIR
jgi:hypothetical protein